MKTLRILVLITSPAVYALASDWPSFLGPDGSARSAGSVPTTPAISDGKIYLRSDHAIFFVGE